MANWQEESRLENISNFKQGHLENCEHIVEFSEKPFCREQLVVHGIGGMTTSYNVLKCQIVSSVDGKKYDIDVETFPGIDKMDSGKICLEFN